MIAPKKKELRLAWLGANPALTWGLSIVTRELLKRLKGFEKFILALQREPMESMGTPSYRVYTANKSEGVIHWLRFIKPDVIVIYNPVQWLNHYADAMKKMDYVTDAPIITYLTVELEPLLPFFAEKIHEIQPEIVITPSKWSSSVFEKEGFTTDYLYHGVDTRIFHPMPLVKQQREKFIYGCITRNDNRKGIPRLIKAFSMLPDKDKCSLNLNCSSKERLLGSDLDIVGGLYKTTEGIDFHEMTVLGIPLDTTFMGSMYNYFDVHVLPTSGEAFGLPILESQACGIPNIVTDLPVLREIYEDTVMYVPTDGYTVTDRGEMPLIDIDALAARMEILRLDQDRCQELAKKGIEHAKKYTWEDAALKLTKILHEYL